MNSRSRESMENLSAIMTLLFVCIGAFRVIILAIVAALNGTEKAN